MFAGLHLTVFIIILLPVDVRMRRAGRGFLSAIEWPLLPVCIVDLCLLYGG